MKPLLLLLLLVLFGSFAFGQTVTNDPILGSGIPISMFKIPKDWKLITVDWNGSSSSQATLWFQSANGDVYIVNGDYSGNGSFQKRNIGKISALQ
jgi:hypothetical protein